jgi:hypothetical protein
MQRLNQSASAWHRIFVCCSGHLAMQIKYANNPFSAEIQESS